MNRLALSLFFPILLFFAGCAAHSGVYHTVGKNETLWRISKTYGVKLQDVAEFNNIRDVTEIEAGQKIFIPGASRTRKVKPYAPSAAAASVNKDLEDKIVIEKDRFGWPVKGEVISRFGVRNGGKHDGIDIKAKEGTPVKAAEDGKVVYVNSSMRGYGNIVIIMHKDDYYTVYAHNKENLVRMGDKVSKGDVVASLGSTGNASTEHLHFEVRHGKSVRNPLFFLP